MARVKSTGTTPEIAVRRMVHGLGYRFRLHCRDLPGTPDLVLPKHRAVIPPAFDRRVSGAVSLHMCFVRYPNVLSRASLLDGDRNAGSKRRPPAPPRNHQGAAGRLRRKPSPSTINYRPGTLPARGQYPVIVARS